MHTYLGVYLQYLNHTGCAFQIHLLIFEFFIQVHKQFSQPGVQSVTSVIIISSIPSSCALAFIVTLLSKYEEDILRFHEPRNVTLCFLLNSLHYILVKNNVQLYNYGDTHFCTSRARQCNWVLPRCAKGPRNVQKAAHTAEISATILLIAYRRYTFNIRILVFNRLFSQSKIE